MLDLHGYGWMLWEGVATTIVVAILAMAVGCALGLGAAWAKLAGRAWARRAAETYTTVVRGVPELVLILLVYYGMPTLVQGLSERWGEPVAFNLDPFAAGVLTLGFIYGAFSTDVFRGAFLAVPRGQIEAAAAMGMGPGLAFRRVIFPQMLRYALPGLGNVWLVLLKATALVSVIQLEDLMRKAQIAAGATREPFTFYFAASLLFLGLTALSMAVIKRGERWAEKGTR